MLRGEMSQRESETSPETDQCKWMSDSLNQQVFKGEGQGRQMLEETNKCTKE